MLQKQKSNIQQEYLGPKEVAQILGVSERTAHNLIHAKDDPIPSHRISSKLIRVWRPDLHKWMEKRREDVSQVDTVVDEVLSGF